MKPRRSVRFLPTLVLLALVGCSSTTNSGSDRCTAAATEPCLCGALAGERTCGEDGTFGACSCEGGTGGSAGSGSGGSAGAGVGGTSTGGNGGALCQPRGPEESLDSERLALLACSDGNDDACDGCDCGRKRQFVELALGDSGAFATPFTHAATGATLELWVRLEQAGAGAIVTAGNLSVRVNADGMAECWKSGDEYVPAEGLPLALGTWTHVACVAAADTLVVYVDGLARAATIAGTEWSPLVVQGLNPDGTLNVAVDELRYSEVPRYSVAFEPAQRFATDAETLALYHFDEGPTSALDYAGATDLALPPDATATSDDCFGARFP